MPTVLPDIMFRGLRHGAATLLLAAGVLGHRRDADDGARRYPDILAKVPGRGERAATRRGGADGSTARRNLGEDHSSGTLVHSPPGVSSAAFAISPSKKSLPPMKYAFAVQHRDRTGVARVGESVAFLPFASDVGVRVLVQVSKQIRIGRGLLERADGSLDATVHVTNREASDAFRHREDAVHGYEEVLTLRLERPDEGDVAVVGTLEAAPGRSSARSR